MHETMVMSEHPSQEAAVSKQERRAKAEAKANEQASEIIEQATRKAEQRLNEAVAKAEAEAAPAKPRRGALSAEHAALAPQVKELRDKGMAWWQIGFELHLPGSADNVREGKGGAAFARKVYAAGFGEVPRTQVRNGSRANREKNEDVRALKSQRKMDRVAAVRAGVAVLREDMTDEEVVETLRGRIIAWHTDVSQIGEVKGTEPQYLEQSTGVHRKWCKVEVHGEDRCVVFKEYDPTAPLKYRGWAGAVRIVRLKTIHTVR